MSSSGWGTYPEISLLKAVITLLWSSFGLRNLHVHIRLQGQMDFKQRVFSFVAITHFSEV